MDHPDDFAALRNLLALKRLEVPMDTEVNRFLIEFHRRQRAQLLVPQSRGLIAWLKEKADDLGMFPSLSYASACAAVVLAVFLGLSQQAQVREVASQFTLLAPSHEAALAMVPVSLGNTSLHAKKWNGPTTFGASRVDATTRFVLASAQPGYDASPTF